MSRCCKTGGKLATIEIDRARHETATGNFEKAGVSSFVDARLGDAHEQGGDLDHL
jgi:predicted O-methyltransferase YrrM